MTFGSTIACKHPLIIIKAHDGVKEPFFKILSSRCECALSIIHSKNANDYYVDI